MTKKWYDIDINLFYKYLNHTYKAIIIFNLLGFTFALASLIFLRKFIYEWNPKDFDFAFFLSTVLFSCAGMSGFFCVCALTTYGEIYLIRKLQAESGKEETK